MPRVQPELLLCPCSREVHARKAEGAGCESPPAQIGISVSSGTAPPLKVYLSVPMIANRAVARAQLMAKAITDAGHTVTSPWVLGPIESQAKGSVDVFQRDTRATEDSDAIVADVTEPSIGVGMELMAAYKAGRRIIIVARKGNVKSGMLTHMDRKETVEYEDEGEIYSGLMRLL